MLTAYYDLSCSPPTYDFVSFLLAAETRRLSGGHGSLEVRVLPGPADGFREDRLPPRDPVVRRSMLQRIVVPMTELLPSCTGCEVETRRPHGRTPSIGYGLKTYGLGHMVRASREGLYPLLTRAPIVSDHVTITLRECSYHPTRNANVGEWVRVGRWLQARGIRVLFIRDTERANEPLEDFQISALAAIDVKRRADLYAGARLNLFTSNGPAWLSLFMGAPTFICKMINQGVKMAQPETFARCGVPVGSTWPNLRPRQQIAWHDDTADKIIPAVEALLECA